MMLFPRNLSFRFSFGGDIDEVENGLKHALALLTTPVQDEKMSLRQSADKGVDQVLACG